MQRRRYSTSIVFDRVVLPPAVHLHDIDYVIAKVKLHGQPAMQPRFSPSNAETFRGNFAICESQVTYPHPSLSKFHVVEFP